MLELSRTPPQAPKIEACFACSGSEQARHTHPDFSSENSLFGDPSCGGGTEWGRQVGPAGSRSCSLAHYDSSSALSFIPYDAAYGRVGDPWRPPALFPRVMPRRTPWAHGGRQQEAQAHTVTPAGAHYFHHHHHAPCRGKGSREDHGGKRIRTCFWASLRSRIQPRTLKVHTPSDLVAWWNDGAS